MVSRHRHPTLKKILSVLSLGKVGKFRRQWVNEIWLRKNQACHHARKCKSITKLSNGNSCHVCYPERWLLKKSLTWKNEVLYDLSRPTVEKLTCCRPNFSDVAKFHSLKASEIQKPFEGNRYIQVIHRGPDECPS